MELTTPSSNYEGSPQPSASLPITFDRRFVVVRYHIGHSQLVLRSTPHSTPDYIEVTFEAVAGMKLVPHYEPLTIDIAEPALNEEMAKFCGLREPSNTGYRCYKLESERGDGLVMCAGYRIFLHPREAEGGAPTVRHQNSQLILKSEY
ncbi:hypothetical protein [Nocardia sp. NPDC050175]|uniref:hypothetical protein n=1 Tax=Nocardia sp. NPDC050175 TaxID=3364317 RepID=UPI0037BC0C03